MTHIAVLSGGLSEEREVSLRSGKVVSEALRQAGYQVTEIDFKTLDDDLEKILLLCDVVFPALHGAVGEDGVLQEWLEERNITFIGAGAATSALCFDKWKYRQALGALNIPIPPGELVSASTIWHSGFVKKPYVLKPYDGGSSLDTFIVRDVDTANKTAIEETLGRRHEMLIEALVEGHEITVGVLHDEALPVIEIIPPSDGEFDYANKYNGKTQELCPPRHISAAIQQEAQELALLIHKSLDIRDTARTDMMIDAGGALYVLETNTLPGMTETSLIWKAGAAAGYSKVDFVKILVETALARR